MVHSRQPHLEVPKAQLVHSRPSNMPRPSPLVRVASLLGLVAPLASAALGPEQLNLALTAGGPTEMAVSWVSLDAWTPATHGSVTWAAASAPAAQASAPARTHTYTAGFGWTGSIFWATMTGLTPGAAYTYTVEANGNASAPRAFLAAPLPNASASARVAVLADMGTVELLGFEVRGGGVRAGGWAGGRAGEWATSLARVRGGVVRAGGRVPDQGQSARGGARDGARRGGCGVARGAAARVRCSHGCAPGPPAQ